jgi:pimeloyl-ACP methyl ester carboxylesterase
MGGGVALVCALVAPDRIAGLVLVAPAVSGAPTPELDAATQRFDQAIDQADAEHDRDGVNRLETWLWLDGPSAPEGRVSGPARDLALEMNGKILAQGEPEEDGSSGFDTWSRLEEINLPVVVACGELDVPFLIARSHELASRLPRGRHRDLPGMAHLPYLERPAMVADLVMEARRQG